MREERTAAVQLIAEIQAELAHLAQFQDEIASLAGKTDIVSRRAKGSILHDFYTPCERVFKKIAIEVNHGYDDRDTRHKSLLHRMTLPLEGIRPAVISEELAAELDEYLAFRHLFRNIYGFELKSDRIDRLAAGFDTVRKRFSQEMKTFVAYLRQECAAE